MNSFRLSPTGLIADASLLLAVQLALWLAGSAAAGRRVCAAGGYCTFVFSALFLDARLLRAACLLACFPTAFAASSPQECVKSAGSRRFHGGDLSRLRRFRHAPCGYRYARPCCLHLARWQAPRSSRWRRSASVHWQIDVCVEKRGLIQRFPALIDTGNRLREHQSGMPVLIVESRAIPALARLARQLPESETRRLPFGVLGGGGQMRCFYPGPGCA